MAAQATVEVQHPTLADVRHTVSKDKLQDWLDQGWVRVKQAGRSDAE